MIDVWTLREKADECQAAARKAETDGDTLRDFYWRGAEAALRHMAGDAAMIPFEKQVTA